ncbi:MAG: ribosome biogenesis GTPase Der, partial [Nitrospinaceae bacterium]
MAAPLSHIAIIGRANVGKSTLFNRLIRRRRAIVNDTPGVTRDRMYGQVEGVDGKLFMLIDTGGIDMGGMGDVENQVQVQGDFALAEADGIVFLVDCRQGLTPQDRDVLDKVRKSGKPMWVGVNKVDTREGRDWMCEFSRLGLKDIFPISAEHGEGVVDLLDAVCSSLSEASGEEEEEEDEAAMRVAIVGRPNVGKSSLINRLLKEERCVVSATPGTTRDSIDTTLEFQGRRYLFTDTAGIRRRGKTREVLEKFSVIMALKALERCDIAVILVDAAAGITDQDATIAGYAFERGRGCVLAVNKWDLAKELGLQWDPFTEQVKNKLKFLDFAPIMPTSANTGRGISRLFAEIDGVFAEYCRQIPTGKLNDFFARAIRKNPMS